MSNRAAVKRRLRDIATFAVTTTTVDLGPDDRSTETVPVAYGLPPSDASSTCVYFGGLDNSLVIGRTDPDGIQSGFTPTGDVWTQRGTIDAYGFEDQEQAEEAAERILNAFVTVLHRCNMLVDPTPDGVSNDDPDTYKVQSAVLADWSFDSFQPEGDGVPARLNFQIRCTASSL